MKLIIEKHPEQTKLSQYFKKIESIALRKGVEVDELLLDIETNESASETFFRNNLLTIKRNEKLTFLNNEDL